jgi:hypothetical protein
MRSSIFNSKSSAMTYAKVLCVICLVFVIGTEALSTYLLKRRSVTYRRVFEQISDAATARPARDGQPISVVMIGNSLFLDGVQVERLRTLTSDNMNVYPVFLEGTGYYDWLYALRRIFREGGRPDVVVVQLEANSFLWNSVRTEYSPLLFFDAADMLEAGSALGLDHTARSSLLLAHWSAFWGTHSIVRTQILRHTVPHFADLFSLMPIRRNALTQVQQDISSEPQFESTAALRMRTLGALCEGVGAKMIMLVPPTPSSENAVRKLAAVSKENNVPLLVPIDASTLTAQHYEPDAFHLNSQGAAIFTLAIARISDRLYKKETARSSF